MTFLIISFVAGLITVLAPCVLPLLPVVIGSSASGRSKNTPYIVVVSLAISIILFTFVLKVSTAFINVPQEFWSYISGAIIFLFGLVLLFPSIWDNIPGLSKLSVKSNKLVGEGYMKKTFWGDVLIGISLGPVFSTCSPTYFVILASVLPVSYSLGVTYLLAYVIGLSIILLLIALLGQHFADRLSAISDPNSKTKKVIGLLFIILGILIFTGYEKKIEAKILSSGFFDVTQIENKLLSKVKPNMDEPFIKIGDKPYVEIVNPSGFVNTDSIKIKDLVGKKVIIIDFLTYSCINCQRTFPYMNALYEKYKDSGLEIIGIHTPEFAFEKDIKNVKEAMMRFGIKYPIVLDNDYATWNAYGNQYWPRKYIIDINGNIVYDHIGEGGYEETEMKVKELLEERAKILGLKDMNIDSNLATKAIKPVAIMARSPETYFGAFRNEYLENGRSGIQGEQDFVLPKEIKENSLYLKGKWNIEREYAESVDSSSIFYKYNSKEVYIVGDSDNGIEIEILQDGKPIGSSAGQDVDKNGIMKVKESRLYKVVNNKGLESHTLELRVKGKGFRAYAFTFG